MMRKVAFNALAADRRGPKTRQRTMASALALATMLAMPATAAVGAGFAGTGNVAFGSVTIGAGNDTITVNSPTAIINWTPSDSMGGTGAIDFLPPTNSVAYAAGGGLPGGEYTVLNRITPISGAQSIALNGTITSNPAGNIWFYSPNGILVGAGATFNVGGLLFTTADISPSGVTLDPEGYVTSVNSGTSASGRTVRIESTSTITTSNYFAILAPKIEQVGTVNAGGSVAYIAAEQAKLSIADTSGLFDIEVGVGTDVANAITHGGVTTATVNGPQGTSHGIYMVAVPKNTAISMLLDGGNIGFQVAGGAQLTDQGVVLSAGRNISFGSVGAVGEVSTAETGTVSITGGDFGGPVYMGGAFGDVAIQSNGSSVNIATGIADTSFLGNLSIDTSVDNSLQLSGIARGGNIQITGSSSRAIDFNGNVTLNANAKAGGSDSGTGGNITITSAGGTINFNGDLTASANGYGGNAGQAGDGGLGRGGDVIVDVGGGTINLSNGMDITALGRGGNSAAGNGGAGRGGLVRLQAFSNGLLNIPQGSIELDASSIGGDALNGIGGDALSVLPSAGTPQSRVEILTASGGVIDLGHDANGQPTAIPVDIFAYADGEGGDGLSGGLGNAGSVFISASGSLGGVKANSRVTASASGTGGSGTGDTLSAQLGGRGLGGEVLVLGSAPMSFTRLDLRAQGTGGYGFSTGGNGIGGTTNVTDTNQTFDIGTMSVRAIGQGGDSETGAGGAGVGGTAFLFAQGTGAQLSFADDVYIDVTGLGGYGETDGGAGFGGLVNAGVITANNTLTGGSLLLNGFFVNADGVGRDGSTGTGGAGTGGFARLFADTGSIASNDSITITADSIGGSGHNGGNAMAVPGAPNVAPKGHAAIGASGGNLTLTQQGQGSVFLSSTATAGQGDSTGVAGTAKGGTARIANNGSGSVSLGSVQLDVSAGSLSGGDATGGASDVTAAVGGSISMTDLQVYADASGGYSQGSSALAGTGTGGFFYLSGNGGSITISDYLEADVTGYGGSHDAGFGGDGTGGNITIGSGSGALELASINLYGDGYGGDGLLGGGGGRGGNVVVSTQNAGGQITIDSYADLSATGEGGYSDEGAGGDGIGGKAGFDASRGTITVNGAAFADTSGFGGDGYQGGDGFGGSPEYDPVTGAMLQFGGAFADAFSGTLNFNDASCISECYAPLELRSTGVGGSGWTNQSGAIGGGGDGIGGYAEVFGGTSSQSPTLSSILADQVYITVTGAGGYGGNSVQIGTAAGDGGDGVGGQALISAQSGYGDIELGSTYVDAFGFGGAGGFGATASDGGAGGTGTGGFIQLGTISGPSGAVATDGKSLFTDVTLFAVGEGGEGGWGGDGDDSIGASNGGNGGMGGTGTGGEILVNAFGGYTAIDTLQMVAIGQSGLGGGAGIPTSNGIDGIAGLAGQGIGGLTDLRVTPRSGTTTILGSMDIGDVLTDASGLTEDSTGVTQAGSFAVTNIGGTLTVNGSATFLALGDSVSTRIEFSHRGADNEFSTGTDQVPMAGGSTSFVGPVSVTSTGPVRFTANPQGSLSFAGGCTVNGVACPPPTSPPPPPPPPPLVVGQASLLDATSVSSYSQTLTASGGSGSGYSFVITGGSLPPGISLSPNGQLSGTPTTQQLTTYTFEVTVTDSNNAMATMSFSLTVQPPVIVSPPPPPPVVVSPPPPPPPPVVVSPPPPPPPPPPVQEVVEVIETVSMETSKISSSIQSSLTGSRTAGGSVSSSSGGDTGGSETAASATSSSSAASAADSGGDDGGSAADEGGDDDSAEGGSTETAAVANPNVVVDTSTITTTSTQIDTPITSTGNASLWTGADGLGDVGGAGDIGGGGGPPGGGSAPGGGLGSGSGGGLGSAGGLGAGGAGAPTGGDTPASAAPTGGDIPGGSGTPGGAGAPAGGITPSGGDTGGGGGVLSGGGSGSGGGNALGGGTAPAGGNTPGGGNAADGKDGTAPTGGNAPAGDGAPGGVVPSGAITSGGSDSSGGGGARDGSGGGSGSGGGDGGSGNGGSSPGGGAGPGGGSPTGSSETPGGGQ